jgi:GNAT superfamily N-acetyltransferase
VGVVGSYNFFRNNAKDQHSRNRVRVYTAVFENKPIGYYYLVAKSDEPKSVSKEAIEKFGRVQSTPCVYLGMIGVCLPYQGCGLGKLLMLHAMRQTLAVAEIVGLYALTLEAIDEPTAKIYERWDFKRFEDGGLQMYIPLSTIKALFQNESNAC